MIHILVMQVTTTPDKILEIELRQSMASAIAVVVNLMVRWEDALRKGTVKIVIEQE